MRRLRRVFNLCDGFRSERVKVCREDEEDKWQFIDGILVQFGGGLYGLEQHRRYAILGGSSYLPSMHADERMWVLPVDFKLPRRRPGWSSGRVSLPRMDRCGTGVSRASTVRRIFGLSELCRP